MVQLSLVPNLNLRRLIKDLLNEGGEGLYVHHVDEDDSSEPEQAGGRESANTEEVRDYRFALVAEHILVLKVCTAVCRCTLPHSMGESVVRDGSTDEARRVTSYGIVWVCAGS